MESVNKKNVLISGASMAGLSTAYWLTQIGYHVTVVELANEPRVNGAAVDMREEAIDVVKRMGLFETFNANSLHVAKVEFKNADDGTEGALSLEGNDDGPDEDIEIERDKFVAILMNKLQDNVEFIFNNSITALHETEAAMHVTFRDGSERIFDLVFGCDGLHSMVRKIWFGHESEYVHFLGAYFSITIVNKLLAADSTMQMYNVPSKAVTLNAYNHKTDIIFSFLSEHEISYDYRNSEQQRAIISEQFANQSWRTPELLAEVQQSANFYFDKFCQVKMPSWTRGRVALVGDAGYCASPAAGMGASLAVVGAATVADALQTHNGDFTAAFQTYNQTLRPIIERVQAVASANIEQNFIPKTDEAIRYRNAHTTSF